MRYLISIAILLVPLRILAFPDTSILDTFDGTANPIGGIWSDAVFNDGGCQKSAGEATRTSGGNQGCWVTITFTMTNEVFATYNNATNHASNTTSSLFLCLQDNVGTATTDGYALTFKKLDAAADLLKIERIDNAAFTQIGSNIDQEIDDNDDLGLFYDDADGSMDAWFNDAGGGWNSIGTETDTNHTCTNTAIGIGPTNGSHLIDDFGGGNFAAVGSPFIWLRLGK